MIYNILITYGIAYLITQSVLLEKPRAYLASKHWFIGELLYCPICISFWIGLALTQNMLGAFAIMGSIALIHLFIYETKK